MTTSRNSTQAACSGPETEFALGAVYGFREWRYFPEDELLKGLYGQTWEGVRGNVATCLRQEKITYMRSLSVGVSQHEVTVVQREMRQMIIDATKDSPAPARGYQVNFSLVQEPLFFGYGSVMLIADYTRPDPCTIPIDPDCTCGFYAYHKPNFTEADPLTYKNTVFGLSRGYGHVTLGDKGFRAEKMDIVALVNPNFTKSTGEFPAGVQIVSSIDELYGIKINLEREQS